MQQNELSEWLHSLGNTPGMVAASLRSSGVQGVRNTTRFLNPVVRYIQSRLNVDVLSVDVIDIDKCRLTLANGQNVIAAIPTAVRMFLNDFNLGHFPFLEMDIRE